jgi:hypothetical protein
MKLIKTSNGTEIKIYSSSKELSITRYTEFQKYLVIEASTEALLVKIKRSKAYVEEGKYPFALIELENSINCLNAVLNGVGIYTYAFCCLVAEIGGKTVLDTTEDGLQNTLRKLIELEVTIGDIEEVVDEVKKK